MQKIAKRPALPADAAGALGEDPATQAAPKGEVQIGPPNPTRPSAPQVSSRPRPPGTPGAATGAPGTATVAPKAAVQGIAAVKTMQTAIIQLADALIANPAFGMKDSGNKTHTFNGQDSNLAGHDQFNKYLVSKYIQPQVGNAQHGAVGFQNVDISNSVDRMGPAKPLSDPTTNMRNMAMTLRHVGSKAGGGEGKPDGVWGPRTHNAIKLMAVLAGGLVTFANALGIKTEYTALDAQRLRAAIPDTVDGIEDKDKVNFAKAITGQAKLITAMVGQFSEQVMNNPEFAPLMSQDEPMFSNENAKQEMLTDQEQTFLQGNNGTLPGTNVPWKQVQDPKAFAEWMSHNGKGTDNASMFKEIDALLATVAKAPTSRTQGTI